jgi:hypothetical protein
MRIILAIAGLIGIFVIVAMTIAPSQPVLRNWYIANACDQLDKLSTDICAAMRREAGKPS